MKTTGLPNGTPIVFERAAAEAEPGVEKTRAAHTHPIDVIGGRRQILYAYPTRKRR
jgi:hypothetical protein